MIKRIISVLVLSMLLTGCTVYRDANSTETEGGETMPLNVETSPSEETAVDYDVLYSNILEDYLNVIVTGEPGELPAGWGVVENRHIYDEAEALSRVGYDIMDISGDGVPELVIGSVSGEGETTYGTMLYGVYTVVDGEPVFSFGGWQRNSFRPLGNGEFFNQGSGGARYSRFGIFTLSEDATELSCKEYYFTFEKDESATSEIGCYYNTTGEQQKSVSVELDMTLEEFWSKNATLAKASVNWELTPFSTLQNEAPETEAPETEAPETEVPETEVPETEVPETEAPETEVPEMEAPETEAPETEAPETEAPETEAPETEAPETDVTVPEETSKENNLNETSSHGVYITETGKKYHSTKGCSGLSRAKKIYESTLEEAKALGLDPCAKCY